MEVPLICLCRMGIARQSESSSYLLQSRELP
ncbi:hypothetical protein [Escherichia phage PH1062]|nr:hypothetical protein [Escherichia phage PH1062]